MRAPSTGKVDSLLGSLKISINHEEGSENVLSMWQKKAGFENLDLAGMNALGQKEVLLLGKIGPPKIFCPRILTETEEGQKIIPVALKRQSGCQKFRVPFRNEGSSENEVEFSFIKVGENPDALLPNEYSMNEVLEFYCMPGTLKIAKNSNQILSMLIKVNYEKIKEIE